MGNNGNTAVTDETLRELSRMIEKLANKEKKRKKVTEVEKFSFLGSMLSRINLALFFLRIISFFYQRV